MVTTKLLIVFPNIQYPTTPLFLPFPLLMVTELRAAMVNGRILSDEGWTAEVTLAEETRRGSVAAAPFSAAFTSDTSVAPGTASASTPALPSALLRKSQVLNVTKEHIP